MNPQAIRVKTNNAEETQLVAQKLAKMIKNWTHASPLILALTGDLGAGKTTFIKGLARALGVRQTVSSPTFVLINKYIGKDITVYHVDPYRLEKPETLKPDIEEILKEKNVIIVIEWADKLKGMLPHNRVDITLEHEKGDRRVITIHEPRNTNMSEL